MESIESMEKRRVVIFAQRIMNRAGIERMTIELSNLLCEIFDIKLIIVEHFERERLPYELKDEVEAISLDDCFHGLNISAIKKLRSYLKALRPETLITVATPLARISVPASAGLGIRMISWEHFNLHAGSRIGMMYKIFVSKFVANTVVLTNADRVEMEQHGCRNIIFIPNFSSIGINQPSDLKDKVLLAVGRHTSQKGFDLLLKAWKKADVRDWRLRIIGDGELKEENIKLAENLGVSDSVEFLSNTSDIVSEFRKAGCYIMSSRYEGMPMVLIEAKLMGLPVISFDCRQGPGEVIRNGEDGWLVENGNVDKLGEMIRSVLNDSEKMKEAGRRGRLNGLKDFSPMAVRNKWLALLK